MPEPETGEGEFLNEQQVRQHFRTTFDAQMEATKDRVDPSDEKAFSNFLESTRESIDGLTLIDPAVDQITAEDFRDRLWPAFVDKQVQGGSDFHQLLHDRFKSEVEEETANASDSKSIIRSGLKTWYLKDTRRLARNFGNTIPVSVGEYRSIVDELVDIDETTNTDLAELLDSAREYIRENKPTDSFVLISEKNGQRYGFGVIIRDNQVLSIGINNITAHCQAGRFDSIIGNLPETKSGSGVKLLKIRNNLADFHLDSLGDPHTLPDDLFILKSSTTWGNCPLDSTRVQKEIEEAAGFPTVELG